LQAGLIVFTIARTLLPVVVPTLLPGMLNAENVVHLAPQQRHSA
jgi:hypothetical protein